jgi:putative membrane protein
MKTTIALIVAAVLLLALTGLQAAEPKQNGQLSSKDYKFACAAAQGGMLEVQAGQLAGSQSADPTVKQFGEQMVTDHGKAGDELKALAAQKGATLPGELDSKGQRTLEKLQKLSGADFDKAYAKDMVSDHEKDLKEFQKAANDLDDPDLKSFAARTSAMVSQHLDHAKQMESSVKAK